ncbi:hypothetical protein CXQ81_10225 [Pseudomonas sp. 09C 129]|uniref:O-antigen ligase family protein n=1 Tax=Pseudomonas sp. 09C 129 TaxID=2054915 RepID=UPI000C6CBE89|nr:O-antigen ligase family protein [Pseudomonas sp. 09C 129]AUG00967.1 hypothetical protein CXQ81_10225 [Pseudomonas sp. 09C 129]
MLLFFSALLLCIPLRIFVPALGVEIAPADVLCLFALFYVLTIHPKINRWLLLSIFLSLTSLIFVQSIYMPGNIGRALLSMAFFFKPYLIYLLGQSLGVRNFQPEKFNKTIILLLSITAFAATVDAIFVKHHVAAIAEFERIPGEWILGGIFDPTFFGLKFHGSNGINGIAVFFSFAFMTLLALGVVMKPVKNVKIIACIGMLCCLILVLGSGSRQAAFGVLISGICYLLMGKMTTNRLFWANLSGVFAILVTLVVITFFSQYFVELFAKARIMAENISDGNWDAVSSGRLGLYVILVEDLLKSPIFGTGFSGYGIFDSGLGYFENDVSTSGYTPHNQYLGALWKMGALAGIFYFAFLWNITRPFFRNPQKTKYQRNLYIATAILIVPFFTVFNVFQDGLSSPSTGPLLLFLIGYYRRGLELSYLDTNETPDNKPAQPVDAKLPT